MQKHAPKIIAAILLVTIAVLALIAGGKDGTGIFTTPTNASISDIPTEMSDSVSESNNATVDKMELFERYPKQPIKSARYEFEQKIEVNGTIELNKVHNISGGILIVASAFSDGGDFNTDKLTVVVIKMSHDGVIEQLLRLDELDAPRYIASQITLEGLVVVVQNHGEICVYIIDKDLGCKLITKLNEQVNSASVLTTTDGFLLFTEGRGIKCYLFSSQKTDATIDLLGDEIIDVFIMSDEYILFVSDVNDYHVVFVDKKLVIERIVTIRDRKLISVMPSLVNNEIAYIAMEYMYNCAYITLYNNQYFTSLGACYYLGIADKVEAYAGDESMLVGITQDNKTSIFLVGENTCISSLDIMTELSTFCVVDYYCNSRATYLMIGGDDVIEFISILNGETQLTRLRLSNASHAEFLKYNSADTTIFYATVAENEINIIKPKK
ncbi:MAG: hypothetical protein LBE09_04145 [Christensenellaceae bacterium]|jgi:hypothetical protein|nr:hypothetical protein [Christensenellaceae bacterium]